MGNDRHGQDEPLKHSSKPMKKKVEHLPKKVVVVVVEVIITTVLTTCALFPREEGGVDQDRYLKGFVKHLSFSGGLNS